MTSKAGAGTKSMDSFLENLFEKRGATREGALSSIIQGFTGSCRHQFASKNFATLLYRCLSSFKKGSLKETCLALEALGWLAVTVGCGENAHELYEELLPPLSQALKSQSESVKFISILDCLAIVTFVGGSTVEETERSMQIVWDFFHSETGSNAIAKKHSAAVQTAAISAWSLLLTTVDGWSLSYNHWQGAVSFFLDILETDDGSLHVVACEALALIFEMGCLEKFASGTDGTDASSVHEGNVFPNRFSSVQELREKLLVRVRALSLLAKVESSTTNSAKRKHNTEWEVLIILENGYFPETSVKIGKHSLKLYSWSQLLQLNFLKRLLGGGFVRHMLENQLLHDVFDFTPKAKLLGDELYVSEREEVTVHLFVPEARKKDFQDRSQRIYRSPNSVFRKARTQILNKQRAIRGKELHAIDDGM